MRDKLALMRLPEQSRQVSEVRMGRCADAVVGASHRRGRRAARLAVLLACVSGSIAPLLRAAEHITLRNGFAVDCDHRSVSAELAASGSVRLFLDASEASYLDVQSEDIVGADVFVPAPGVAPAPAATSAGSPVTRKASPSQAELSPGALHEILAGAGTEHDLDVDLLASLVHAESGSHVHAVSRAGAQGLMQLMPGTAAELGVADPFAPEQNVHGGTAYLDSLLKRYHDNLALALAAYNAGPAAVDRYHGVPPYRETRAYVARIIQEFNRRYAAREAAASRAGFGSQSAQTAAGTSAWTPPAALAR